MDIDKQPSDIPSSIAIVLPVGHNSNQPVTHKLRSEQVEKHHRVNHSGDFRCVRTIPVCADDDKGLIAVEGAMLKLGAQSSSISVS